MRYICENDDIFEHTATKIVTGENMAIETPVCPLCHTAVYSEYVLDKQQITSVISVDLADVDARLKEGYVVESLYAKTATLVMKE